jgi:hypothetical protein
MAAEYFDPTFSPPEKAFRFAPRPSALKGLKIGLIDNGKHNALAILRKTAEQLQARFGMEVAHESGKVSFAHGVDEAELADLKSSCDFVIAGVGD